MVPRLFHRVWLDETGEDPIPERFEGYWARLQEMHPGWAFVTWSTSESLAWMKNLDVFERQATWAGKSDVARYEIVARYGGIYLDTDIEPLRAFDDLLDGDAFAAWETPRLLCPTVLGAPPRHAAVEALVQGLAVWANRRQDSPPNQQTGPHYLTHVWRHRGDVRKLDPVAFYPVGWWERDKLGGPYPPESYAVHHWEQGWDPEAKARIDAAQR